MPTQTRRAAAEAAEAALGDPSVQGKEEEEEEGDDQRSSLAEGDRDEEEEEVEEEEMQGESEDNDDEQKEQERNSGDEEEEEEEEEEEVDHEAKGTARRSSPPLEASTNPTSSTRLDPSLFKAYFSALPSPSTSKLKSSLKKTAPLAPPTQAELRAARQQRKASKAAERRREERRGGIVLGRDGRPMKRLQDGRTVVRSLSDPTARNNQSALQQRREDDDDDDDDEGGKLQLPEETYLPSRPAGGEDDVSDLLASHRSSRFLKRKLGLGRSSLSSSSFTSLSGTTKGKKRKTSSAGPSADDPLGLQDPAFLPGGEFAHLAGLTGKKKRGKRAGRGASGSGGKRVEKSELRGDALRTLPGRMGGGAAIVFNRSSR